MPSTDAGELVEKRKMQAMQASANVIASRANPRVKQLRAAFAGHARLSGGMVAIEGHHLLEEALRSGMVLKTIFLTDDLPPPEYVPASIEIVRLAGEVFDSLMETRSPQGVAALMVPPVSTIDDLLWGIPLILVAAGLQDPGNLGSLVRSAEAFGASGVLATTGSVSAWNGKALRASVGSVFRLPVVAGGIDDLRTLAARGVKIVAAVGSTTDHVVELAEADLTGSTAILIGNEGAGLTEEFLELAETRITISFSGPVESLNAAVAGSIILYEAHRQRARVGLRS